MHPLKRLLVISTALLVAGGLAGPAFAAEWFVAPSGAANGSGSRESPWDLRTALSHPSAVKPGDTIWLRGGTYRGIFLSKLSGTADKPIVVRNYSNESVTLDANVRTNLARVVDATTTSIMLTDADAVTPRLGMWLLLESDPAEAVRITDVRGNSITVTRGYAGSTARDHAAGTSVRPADQAILTVEGAYTWFWGMEFTNTDPVRVTDVSGSHPYNGRNNGLDVTSGQGIRIINTVWHDLGGGWGVWKTAADFVGYGNIIYNNGWDSPDRLHGHGIYTQNDTPGRIFSDNIIWSSFANAINQYGSSSAVLDNITWEGNVLYGRRILFGGVAPTRNLTLRENFFYDKVPEFGYEARNNDGLRLEGNYIPLQIFVKWWKNITLLGNVIFRRDYSCPIDLIFETLPPPASVATYRFDSNRYYYSYPSPNPVPEWPICWRVTEPYEQGLLLFSEWQALGQDVDSTMTMLPVGSSAGRKRMTLPSPVVFLRKNKYQENRAHLIIYNWDLADTVTVPADRLAGLLQAGEKYRLLNAQDYFGDRQLGTYDGTGLKIAMTGRSAVKPIGFSTTTSWYHDPSPVGSTFPEFGVFVLEVLPAGSTSMSRPSPPADVSVD